MSKSKDARIAELEVNLAQAEANAAAYGKYIIELEARIAEIESTNTTNTTDIDRIVAPIFDAADECSGDNAATLFIAEIMKRLLDYIRDQQEDKLRGQDDDDEDGNPDGTWMHVRVD